MPQPLALTQKDEIIAGMQRIIVDTDPGIDDAIALLYALGSARVRVEAITAVHGNVPVEVATQNVFEILHASGVEEAPEVAQGCAAPLLKAPVNATVHGEDGLGGWTAQGRVPCGKASNRTAADLITSTGRRHPGEVTLVMLGPMTNAAAALRQDAEGFRMLKGIVLMGGTVWEPGNMTAVAEFNIFVDPEAAREVLNCGLPIVTVGLDVTRKGGLTRERLEDWLAGRSDRRSRFLRCICEHALASYRRTMGLDVFHLHDPLAVAVALDRSLVETRPMKLEVETTGEITRGMLVAERRQWVKGKENADVCVNLDVERFLGNVADRVFC